MASRSRREQALALAAIGLKIFPLPPKRKTPYPKAENELLWDWDSIMTSEPAVINAWFEQMPDMNYAVCPGEHFFIIDLDDKDGKNGTENFYALNYEQVPDDWCIETFTVVTPSGGRHLYLRSPHAIGNSNRHLPQGVDIRGAKGYVVGPGCYTDELVGDNGKIKTYRGTYKIDTETELAEAPTWLLEKLDQHYETERADAIPLIDLDLPANVTQAKEFLATRAPAIQGQNGNDWTYKTISRLKDFGLGEAKMFELLMLPAGWNHRCEPPWSGNELLQIVKNVFRYGQNAPGNKGDLWDAPGAFSAEEYLAKAEQEKQAKRSKLYDILMKPDDIMASDDFAEMIIPEWLPADSFTVLIAERGSGKTVVLMDLACRIACDMEWHDMPMRDDFAVVYICGEYPIGAREMFRGWCLQHNKVPADDRFFFLGDTCDLLNAEDTERWVRFVLEQLKGRRAVIIIDTWQKATATGDQSDFVAMQTAVHHADAFAKSVRGPVIFAAHPPKQGAQKTVLTVMGSSAIENGTAGIWHLTDEGGTRRLTVDRIKGKGKGNYEEFEFVEQDLKRNDPYFGRPLTAVVPKRVGGTTTKGSAEESEAAEAKRIAWGGAVRDVWNDIVMPRDPEGAKKFGLKAFASILRGLPATHPVRATLEFNKEQVRDELGIQRRFKELYQRGGPIPVEAERALKLDGDRFSWESLTTF